MLIEKAEEFFDSNMTFKKKMEYLGSMVSYLNKFKQGLENLELVEKICDSLEIQSTNENPEDIIRIYNQQNRLYAGIFAATQDTAWLDKAIIALKKAISIYEVDFLYSNLAMCYYEYAQEKFEKLTKLSPMDARLLAEELKRQ